jgi:protein gp37
MAENTKIEWAHDTFNAWEGCTKVSPGCANCYAEELSAHRFHRSEWGPDGKRKFNSPFYWDEPLKWNRQAEESGQQRRVFTMSLGDLFEDRPDLHEPRLRLMKLIERTPSLTWLLLTKRPENVFPLLNTINCWNLFRGSRNIWLGASVEDQARAEQRIPVLIDIPVTKHFLSCEPLLGRLEFWDVWLAGDPDCGWSRGVDWVILGGESGRKARPCRIEWLYAAMDQVRRFGVPVFVKQLGTRPIWPEPTFHGQFDRFGYQPRKLVDKKGGDMEEWPRDLQVRELPRKERQ